MERMPATQYTNVLLLGNLTVAVSYAGSQESLGFSGTQLSHDFFGQSPRESQGMDSSVAAQTSRDQQLSAASLPEIGHCAIVAGATRPNSPNLNRHGGSKISSHVWNTPKRLNKEHTFFASYNMGDKWGTATHICVHPVSLPGSSTMGSCNHLIKNQKYGKLGSESWATTAASVHLSSVHSVQSTSAAKNVRDIQTAMACARNPSSLPSTPGSSRASQSQSSMDSYAVLSPQQVTRTLQARM